MICTTDCSWPMFSGQTSANNARMQQETVLARGKEKGLLKAWKVTLLGATSNSR